MALQEEILSQAYDNYIQILASQLGISLAAIGIILFFVFIWSIIWKGFALWKSARRNSWIWFIVLLILNDLGILEILYIFIFSKYKKVDKKVNKK